MYIQVWSDVICPWCYLGKRRLEVALQGFGGPATVIYRAYQLDPTPVPHPVPLKAALAAKFGGPERVDEMYGRGRGSGRLAHPWGWHGANAMLESAITEPPGRGWPAARSTTRTTCPRDREQLRAIAGRLDLVVTGSSDHDGVGKIDHELGRNTTAPEEYERLLDLAEAASARSARTTPKVAS